MAKINATEIYLSLKQGSIYAEEVHCPMIIKTMNDLGTMSAFCKVANISDTTFYRWLNKYPIFLECYRAAKMLGLESWEEEGREGQGNPEFNLELWRTQGAARHGVGKTGRVRVHIDAETNPYGQYKQLLSQAGMGDFTASELKQLMESINVGTRVYETFELQKAVDEMKQDLNKMNQRNGNNIVSIECATKAN